MTTTNNIRACSYDPSTDLVPMTDSWGNTRQYLPVERRLHWFLVYCDEHRISNRILEDDVRMLTDTIGVVTVIIQMHDRDASCAKAGFCITHSPEDSNIIQRAITSAKGRALANLGFGSAFCANDEGGDVVCDSGAPSNTQQTSAVQPAKTAGPAPATAAEEPAASAPSSPSMGRHSSQPMETKAAAPKEAVRPSERPQKPSAHKEESASVPTMTLEEAQSYVLETGIYKGRTMGELVGINKGIVEHYAYKFNKAKAPQLTLAAEIVLKACEEDI